MQLVTVAARTAATLHLDMPVEDRHYLKEVKYNVSIYTREDSEEDRIIVPYINVEFYRNAPRRVYNWFPFEKNGIRIHCHRNEIDC